MTVSILASTINSMKVRLNDIKILNRKREADPQKVKDLAQSISHLGLLNPITITPDLRLLAGLHRTEACKLLGMTKIEAVVKDFEGLKQDLVEIDENLVRHELSILEQGEVLLERDEILSSLGLRAKAGDNQWNNGMAKSARPKTNKDISREMGISDRTIRERKQIAKGIIPEVREQIRNTRYADNAHGLLQLTRQPDHIQKIAVKKILSSEAGRCVKIDVNEPNVVKMAIQQAYREHNLRKFKQGVKDFKTPNSISLYHGDFRKICNEMKPNTIDLILCDPLYAQKAVSLYRNLGDIAMHLLEPSGFFISYVGTMYMPEVMNHLANAGLRYYWTGTVKFGRGRTSVWNRRVWNYVRYFVVFYKEPLGKKAKFFEDFLVSPQKEKDYHAYQQNVDIFTYLISRFSKVGDTVLDPCIGGGTTALAALAEKRKCIGIDNDAKAIRVCKARIADYMKNLSIG